MADIHVTISTGEEAAAGLSSPEIIYVDATADTDDDELLRVWRGADCLTEFPAGRYVSWASV